MLDQFMISALRSNVWYSIWKPVQNRKRDKLLKRQLLALNCFCPFIYILVSLANSTEMFLLFCFFFSLHWFLFYWCWKTSAINEIDQLENDDVYSKLFVPFFFSLHVIFLCDFFFYYWEIVQVNRRIHTKNFFLFCCALFHEWMLFFSQQYLYVVVIFAHFNHPLC